MATGMGCVPVSVPAQGYAYPTPEDELKALEEEKKELEAELEEINRRIEELRKSLGG
ncbi:hypothetical protein Arcve_1883 [Archaeoglobus veneficus SNP6]|uniref:Uncharacterized protein n=2 Tax=Archaeoglobus veneficus TaxID=58290 RepID=F2KRE2_ARCVS|nr:hypothetical protein Arcve_1883 [Archaeoglobus veneficus SNP6]